MTQAMAKRRRRNRRRKVETVKVDGGRIAKLEGENWHVDVRVKGRRIRRSTGTTSLRAARAFLAELKRGAVETLDLPSHAHVWQNQETGTWWISYTLRSCRIRRDSKSTRRAEAEELLGELLRRTTAGEENPERSSAFVIPDVPDGPLTVGGLRAIIARQYVIDGRRSLKTVLSQWQHITRYFGEDCPAEDLTIPAIEGYKVRRLADGASRATVNHQVGYLQRALNLAAYQGLVDRVPKVMRLSLENVRTGFIEPHEFQRLQSTLDHLDQAAADVVEWLYLTGWRSSEATSLTWREIDLDASTVALPQSRSKNRAPRHVRIPGDLRSLLMRRFRLRLGDYVFHRAGRRVRRFAGCWKRAVEALRKPDLRPHDLRRSFARNALRAGVPQRVIMEIGGWKTTAMFHRYAIVDEQQIERGLEAVARFVNLKNRSA